VSGGLAACTDCGVDTVPLYLPDRSEFYMVHNALWDAHGCGEGYLCVGCFEARLGRTLAPADFSDVPLNDPGTVDTPRYAWSYRTARLTARLRGTT